MTEGQGWFSKLKAGLSRSSTNLKERIAGVTGVLTKRKLDAETVEELEEALIAADLGVETSAMLVKEFARDRFGKEVSDAEIREALATLVARELQPYAQPMPDRALRPQVVLVCGV